MSQGLSIAFPSLLQRCLEPTRMKKLSNVLSVCLPWTAPGRRPTSPLPDWPTYWEPSPCKGCSESPTLHHGSLDFCFPLVTGEARPHCRFKLAWLLESWEGQVLPSEWKEESCEPQLKNYEVLIKASRFLSRRLDSPTPPEPSPQPRKAGWPAVHILSIYLPF